MTDPLPCPCCSSDKIVMRHVHPGPGEFPFAQVICCECGINVRKYHEHGRRRWVEAETNWADVAMKYVIESWNRRPGRPPSCGGRCEGPPYCQRRQPSGNLICTQPRGHSGPHIACSNQKHNLAIWNDDTEVAPTAPAKKG